MKQILTHKARDIADVIELLKRGSFSCPNLPHYRYRQTQEARAKLLKYGMLKFTGKTEVGSNYVASAKFKQWQSEFETGKTVLQPIKWAKLKKQEAATDEELVYGNSPANKTEGE